MITRELLVGLALLSMLACAAPPDPNAVARCPVAPDADVLARLAGAQVGTAGNAIRGGEIFAVECARCHSPRLADRSSRIFHDSPRLNCDTITKANPAYLHKAIAEGGPAVNRDKLMKPFADQLTRQQIDDLVAHLLAGAN